MMSPRNLDRPNFIPNPLKMRSHTDIKHFLTPAAREIQIYIDRPSQFMIDNQRQLLPTWDVSIGYAIVVLQKSRLPLADVNPDVIQEKNYLREQFLRFGCDLIFQLRDCNYKSDLFDPRSGYPLINSRGNLTLNDNAVVNALLGFTITKDNNCSLLTHPQWETAVYPSTIVSTASLEILESMLLKITTVKGWKLINTNVK